MRFFNINSISKRLFNIVGHENRIFPIEYDSTHEVITSCSKDKSIKFFKLKDGKNLLII